MAAKPLTDSAEQALKQVEECNGFHDNLVTTVEQRRKQFEGILERDTRAADWMSQAHPPFINHIVETTIAGLLDDRFSFRVRPKPRFFNPGEFERAKAGAKAHEILLRDQLKNDHFNEFQRPYALDAAVVGLGVAKTFWLNEVGKKKQLVIKDAREVYESYAGLPVPVPVLVEEEKVRAIFDGPVTEAVDLRDMYWHEAAVSSDKARWMAHAIWMSYPDLVKLADKGVYDRAAVESIEKATDEGNKSSLEKDREERGRDKDMIEVLEIWNRETGRVITLGARKAVLRERDWPFYHREYPFVFTSLQPYPRSLRGMSIVEKLAHLQDMTWDLMNQRTDNLRFINNFIQIIKSDVDDPDAFPFEPGAQWFLDDPKNGVEQWAPNPIPAEISLGAEALLTKTMQDLAGGQPFTSTGQAADIGADTATEAALVTNLAQMAVKQMKTQLMYSYERIGCQRLYLNQQFIREPIYVETIGLDNEQEINEILPYLLQGEYLFDVTPMAESMNRAERRAEASSLFQVIVQSAPVAAATGSPWNLRAAQEDLLDSYDIPDKERYLSNQQPQAAPAQPGQQQGMIPAQPPNGVTAPQSIDPSVSPSTQASLSPAQFQSRNLSMTGGVSNAA